MKNVKNIVQFLLIIFPMVVFAEPSKKIILNEILASNSTILKDRDGDYSDWIELYNSGNESISLSGWSLTDSKSNLRKWMFPDVSIRAGEYLVVFASGKNQIFDNNEVHTNFSLSKDGEYLAIVEPGGMISDEFTPNFPTQQLNISYGYYQGKLVFFEIPSPGSANVINTKAQIPEFSKRRGFYDNSFYVSLTVSNPDTKIYYTTDGTCPTVQSTLYTAPIFIEKTTPLSAVGIKEGISSPNVSHTYFFINDIVKQPNNPLGYPDRWGYLGGDIKYPNYAVGERAPADYAMDPTVCEDPTYKSLIQKAFLSIPSLCIVTKSGYLFSESTDNNEGGIYIHTGVTLGDGWERPVSIEYYDPATDKQFQINCGLRLHGAASRQPEKTGKHSFRTVFREMYGEGKLQFDLFDDGTAVNKFDHLVFRAGYNQSWLHSDSWQRANSQYLNDSFAKRIQRDMGHLSAHDRFVHLFINGLYWGLYNVSERINDKFMQAYFGGEEVAFDVINHDGLSDGEITAWNRMLELATKGDFNQLQTEKLLYMENFIDYLLINFYIGNVDWGTNNWYMARNRINPENGFYSFSWDAESSFTDVNLNRINGSNGFQGKLRTILFGSPSGTSTVSGLYNNPEFRLLFADRVNKHFFHGGSLTPEKTADIYKKLVDEIDLAIILESARWGDYRRNILTPFGNQPPLYTRNDYWLPRKEKLLNDYFPKRSEVVYKQLEDLGLVSPIAPPVFSSYGENIVSPIQLTMTASEGTIFYTTNGLDPREVSGNIASFASEYKTPLSVDQACTVKARLKQGTIWSALSESTFTQENVSGTLALKEDNLNFYFQNNSIKVNLPQSGNAVFEIYSVDGKCLQQYKTYCQAGDNRVELWSLPCGVYVCRILLDSSCYSYKFIK